MRGSNQADIDLLFLGRTHRSDASLLDDTQQLGLQPRRHLADLVEKQSAAVRLAKQPRPIRRRAGEGAFDVPEELALEQRFGQGRAIDDYQRTSGALAFGVDGLRDQALARTRLAQNQHGDRHPGDPGDNLAHVPHGGAVAQDALGREAIMQGLLERGGLAPDLGFVERSLEEEHQLLGLEGLGQVVVGALPDGFDGGVDGAEGGHHDDRALGGQAARQRQEVEAIDLRHAQVGDQGVDVIGLEMVRGQRPRTDGLRLEAVIAQPFRQSPGHFEVVVNDKNARLTVRHGGIPRWRGC